VVLLADAKPLFELLPPLRVAELPREAELPPRLDDDLAAAFLGAAFLDVDFLGAAFFDAPPLDEVFEAAFERLLPDERDEDDFDDALLEELPLELLEPDDEDLLLPPPDERLLFLLGTFSPSSLASDKPIAIACLREVTFLPLRPLFN
jgi:hypothetical protein